jgi:hypothetical protein
MYELLSQLGKTSNELLWLAIVGLTDQHVHERITSRRLRRRRLAVHRRGALVQRRRRRRRRGRYDDSALRAADRIVHQDEFDLMLLRHWTLYDSLVHSRYVGTRLGAWKERGAEEIGRLLVTMGLPLDQCREPYATMRAQFKGPAGRPPRRVCAALRPVAPALPLVSPPARLQAGRVGRRRRARRHGAARGARGCRRDRQRARRSRRRR